MLCKTAVLALVERFCDKQCNFNKKQAYYNKK